MRTLEVEHYTIHMRRNSTAIRLQYKRVPNESRCYAIARSVSIEVNFLGVGGAIHIPAPSLRLCEPRLSALGNDDGREMRVKCNASANGIPRLPDTLNHHYCAPHPSVVVSNRTFSNRAFFCFSSFGDRYRR